MTHALTLLAGAALAAGLFALPAQSVTQQEAPASQDLPETLDQQLTLALQQSPEVQVAEAKLRIAQAELRQAQLSVSEQIIEAHSSRSALQQELSGLQVEMERSEKLYEQGMASSQQLDADRTRVAQVEALLTQAQARLRHLVGVTSSWGGLSQAGSGAAWEPGLAPQRPGFSDSQSAYLREAVENIRFQDAPLDKVLEYLGTVVSAPMQIHERPLEDELGSLDEVLVTCAFELTTVENLMSCLSDLVPSLTFVMRDYGVLVTTNFEAERFYSPAIPNVPLDEEAARPLRTQER